MGRPSTPGIDPFTPFATDRFLSKPYGIFENGILYFDYGDRYGKLGKYSNPTFVAAYANSLYRDYLQTPSADLKSNFFRNVDYLIETAVSDKDGAYWPYPFENPHFNAPQGWYSGMTSGRVLGLLTRAHHLSGDDKYLKFAHAVFNKLKTPLDSGGMVTYGDDEAWLEEVAWPNAPSTKVLNGHIYALSGLLAYAKYTYMGAAKDLAAKAIKAVGESTGVFDAGFLSYYCEDMVSERPRSFAERGGYNVTHTHQMLWLYGETGNPTFLRQATRYQYYENFNPEITTSSSVNSVTHGPDKMDLTFGNNYWSANTFPVDVLMAFPDQKQITQIVILGHSLATSPSSFTVFAQLGSEWQKQISSNNNSSQRITINLPNTVRTSAIKIQIESAVGKSLVALGGIGIVCLEPFAPVVNFSNYATDCIKLKDGDTNTSISVKTDGFLIVPLIDSAGQCRIYGSFTGVPDLRVSGSNDLEKWSTLAIEPSFGEDYVELAVEPGVFAFLKVEFLKRQINGVSEVVTAR